MCIMACGFLFKPGEGQPLHPVQGSHPHKAPRLGLQMAQSLAMPSPYLMTAHPVISPYLPDHEASVILRTSGLLRFST